MSTAFKETLAKLIENVLSGKLTLDEGLSEAARLGRQWTGDADAIFNEAMHSLIHYCNDDDIRLDSSAYGENQTRMLLNHIRRLRSGVG